MLAAVTVPVSADLDPSAVVLAARQADDRYFCLEQPDRDGFALATLGEAAVVEATGPDRFEQAARACRALGDRAQLDDTGDAGAGAPAGPVWVGGAAFADQGGAAPEWSSLAATQWVMPEVALVRRGAAVHLTIAAVVAGGEDPAAEVERLRERVSSLRPARLPDPEAGGVAPTRVPGTAPPEQFEAAVAQAVEAIRGGGDLRKVVLARQVRVQAARLIDPGAVYGGIREAFPSCYCYLVGTPELAFLGATPELLVRRDGSRAQTVALAGTAGRSDDPVLDRRLGERLAGNERSRDEQGIVLRRIERALGPVSVWVAAAPEPVIVRVRNVQHLATPIRAQLREPVPVLELAGRLHPTPAVGGEPWELAAPLIPALEGIDRGWYAGPVGWMDLAEDGELCVALRCALLRADLAHLYAGNGIVRDSVPADELAETELKLQALLPLIG